MMGSIPHIVEDFLGIVQLFSDGSTKRHDNIDFTPFPVKDDGSVTFKDYCYDDHHHLHLRIYKPNSTTTTNKLPVIYFLHGGGFIVGSFTWPNFHNCCLRLSSALHAIVVAPDYRLAPEHRLPAAVDDSYGALKWIQTMAKSGDHEEVFDFDRFFVIGESSGGNIAHHLAVRVGPGSPELNPVKIRGYIMLAPFFGGTERTKSEVEGSPEKVLTVEFLDMFWRMSLPVGKTADHPFANPFGPNSPSLDQVNLDPILTMVGEKEIMKDRVKLYADRLKKVGKITRYVEFEGKQHGFFTNEPYSDVSDSVLNLIKDFMSEQFS